MNAPISMKTAPGLPTERSLKVGGITPFTATDYPGKLAAVIFVQGCPWRCGYCHNPHLQPRLANSPVPWPQVLDWLRRRIGLIDAVVFSGGEPTIDAALTDAIGAVRALGFEVGLHTAGTYPKRLVEILPLLDWVGLDIKAAFAQYDRITQIAGSGSQAQAAAEAILASGVDYEFRTTIHPVLLPEAEVLALAQSLAQMGAQKYVLQVFRAQGSQDDALAAAAMAGYPGETLLRQVAQLFPHFSVRRS
ncbi:anaerobic ribonucleoside-triphosphate reductase activating protein [Herminiimonas sp. CN]|uniref:anaerobic ribonucleoside-triphosphate reductase activating protein n=1 Tax=Herminiimonas sp. CN TaxID=1349818 RepID=UPI0009E04440|nr:anaerobic ribonucleoside-triphosphate reductase activating protein [Herminiimonas sp. CN]